MSCPGARTAWYGDRYALVGPGWRLKQTVMTGQAPVSFGLIGDAGHDDDIDTADTARRELEEETGWTCGRVVPLHSGPSSAGMSTEMMHFVRALDLRKVGEGGGDDTEDIIVHEVPRKDAGRWLRAMSGKGYSIDPKLFAGLWFLDNAES